MATGLFRGILHVKNFPCKKKKKKKKQQHQQQQQQQQQQQNVLFFDRPDMTRNIFVF